MIKYVLIAIALVGGVAAPGLVKADDDFPPPPPPRMAEMFDFAPGEGLFFAQATGEERRMQRGRGWRRHEAMMRQRKHLEQLRILKMLELLNLSEEQEVPFLTAFNSMRQKQRELDWQTQAVLDSLSAEVNSGSVSEARLNGMIDRAKVLEREKFDRVMAFMDEARTMLSPEQMAKLLIFHKRFEAELLEQVGRFRRGMGGGPGAPGGPPEDEG